MQNNETLDKTTPLRNEVENHIRKLIKPLKEEDELKTVLKVKLTKKEFKVLNCWANDEELKSLLEKLGMDEERYGDLSVKLIKKLNQEKLKQEMMI
jgi:ribosome-associated translation inhibitor RaiA